MDFFEHQQRARRQTTLLVFLYLCAVVVLVGLVSGTTAFIFAARSATDVPSHGGLSHSYASTRQSADLLVPMVWAALATIAIILTGTVFKLIQMSRGGAFVAQSVGGRPVTSGGSELEEQRLVNIVEEMALAAGIPAPPVFVLDNEQGINAFAAGLGTNDAVVAVTRGTLQELSRDELQGVIGHEFSHILNGDMRLNLRLIGVLNGILMIALLGRVILQATTNRSSRSYRDDRRGAMGIAALGVALFALGYAGVFFARIIKAAISRQREFLADASAVQFTRNPAGIADALRKIGTRERSILQDSRAEELSHLFFSEGCNYTLAFLFATHPPLTERIRRIEGQQAQLEGLVEAATPGTFADDSSGLARLTAEPGTVMQRIGTISSADLTAASALRTSSETSMRSVDTVEDAMALVYALAASDGGETPELGEAGRKILGADLIAEFPKIVADITSLSATERFALLGRAMPKLLQAPAEQFKNFFRILVELVQQDNKVSVFEYALVCIVSFSSDAHILRRKVPKNRYVKLEDVSTQLQLVLSTLSARGAKGDFEADRAFKTATASLAVSLIRMPAEQCTLTAFDKALRVLSASVPELKRVVMQSCIECVRTDGVVTPDEGALLRAVGAVLECPIPLTAFRGGL